jgi:hypothetical protein
MPSVHFCKVSTFSCHVLIAYWDEVTNGEIISKILRISVTFPDKSLSSLPTWSCSKAHLALSSSYIFSIARSSLLIPCLTVVVQGGDQICIPLGKLRFGQKLTLLQSWVLPGGSSSRGLNNFLRGTDALVPNSVFLSIFIILSWILFEYKPWSAAGSSDGIRSKAAKRVETVKNRPYCHLVITSGASKLPTVNCKLSTTVQIPSTTTFDGNESMRPKVKQQNFI